MTRPMRVGVALAVVATALLTAAWQRPDAGLFRLHAFGRSGATESRAALSRAAVGRSHPRRASRAHRAAAHGGLRSRSRARRVDANAFARSGLDEVAITTHDVLLPWPEEVSVEMTAPRRWRAAMREEPIAGDPHTRVEHADPGIPYHAYSASGDITAPVVYAGSGATRGLRLADVSRHRRARQDRPRPLLGALQLSRLQGADGRAAWRCRHPHLQRSDRRRPGERQSVPRRPVGTRKSHPARWHRVRLHGPRRSADAGLGINARRAARGRRATRSRCRRSSALLCRSTMPASSSRRSAGRKCRRRGAVRRPFRTVRDQDRQSCGCACGPTAGSVRCGPSRDSFAAASNPTTS